MFKCNVGYQGKLVAGCTKTKAQRFLFSLAVRGGHPAVMYFLGRNLPWDPRGAAPVVPTCPLLMDRQQAPPGSVTGDVYQWLLALSPVWYQCLPAVSHRFLTIRTGKDLTGSHSHLLSRISSIGKLVAEYLRARRILTSPCTNSSQAGQPGCPSDICQCLEVFSVVTGWKGVLFWWRIGGRRAAPAKSTTKAQGRPHRKELLNPECQWCWGWETVLDDYACFQDSGFQTVFIYFSQ